MKSTIAVAVLFLAGTAFLVSTLPAISNSSGTSNSTTLTLTAADDGRIAVNQPPELGQVQWGRDLDAAKKISADTKRPVFLLFQEVPG